jgi:hypothetical protein
MYSTLPVPVVPGVICSRAGVTCERPVSKRGRVQKDTAPLGAMQAPGRFGSGPHDTEHTRQKYGRLYQHY